jgi:hypothetical protein
VLVTHDEGAVEALQPERLMLLPDGIQELWSPDFADLVAVATVLNSRPRKTLGWKTPAEALNDQLIPDTPIGNRA